jgi:hypothetical protein
MTRIFAAVAIALALGLAVARGAAAGTVALFDEGHGQRFLAGGSGELDLSGLAAELRAAGMETRTSRGRITPATLQGVDALVISGPFVAIAADEAEAIRTFVGHGGRLALMIHIPKPLQGLLERIGIQYSRGPVHESDGIIGGRDLDFAVTRFAPHALTDGLAGLGVFGSWALRNVNPQAAEIARTGAKAWLDSDGDGRRSPGEPVGAFGLVVAGTLAQGAYVVFGDDAIFQNRFLESRNRDLAGRLARWLAAAPPGPAPARPGGIRL